ncbi:MAG: transporter [Betaproteobacteria bacterium HGW-Betaproteobacteria-12]|nr:MAG: transporter [Betaproteobacteria bacterium HGW-Betaproteobacteria-12]
MSPHHPVSPHVFFLPSRLVLRLCALAALAAGELRAQPVAVAAPATLSQAFAAAWARQPEAQSLDLRREVAEARRQVAESWTAEPPVLELSAKTDQPMQNQGGREYVAGLALPLWLPGERAHSGALAEAESRATGSRAAAAQLRTAASVRVAWWNWQRARGEVGLAGERLASAQRLAADVAQRVKVGDMARADQHQADGAAASAEMALAEAEALLATARQQLRALTGSLPEASGTDTAEPLPVVPADFSALDAAHPAVAEWLDRVEVARKVADLAAVQTRANPELTVLTTRDRAAFDAGYQQSLTLGVRIPFGSASRQRARLGLAHAEAVESEGQLSLERERLLADLEAARVRVESTRLQLAAADRRAQLARESRTFFDKSFRLGESDLPTRLRIELEAVEAERHSARLRIEHAAAISALRQALGLLPEQQGVTP